MQNPPEIIPVQSPPPQINLLSKLLLAVCIISGLVVAASLITYWSEKNRTLQDAKETAKAEANRAVKIVDQNLQKLSNTATSIAQDLSTGKLTDQELIPRLQSSMIKNPNFFGVGVAYQPYAFNPKQHLYSPYYFHKKGVLTLTTESSYDYTKDTPDSLWYNQPLKEKKGLWLEPFFAKGAQEILAEYSIPFDGIDPKTKTKQVRGVVFGDYSLENLRDMMSSLNLGRSGYAYILSKQGMVIFHPLKIYTIKKTNIFDVLKSNENSNIRVLVEKALKEKIGMVEIENKSNGKSSWTFFQKIPSTNWTMVVVSFKDEFVLNRKREKLIRNITIIALLVFGTTCSALFTRATQGHRKSLWTVAYSTSVLCLAGIGYKWYISTTENSYLNSTSDTIILNSQSGAMQFLNSRLLEIREIKQKQPIYIPTGMMVQTLEFSTANNVAMTGYIWQKYTKGVNDQVQQGVIFPESVSTKLVESYRLQEGNTEVVGWYFEVKLRQNFDYRKYPLDYVDAWVRIWPKDFYKDVILVPDYDAYDLINPSSLPGIEADFVLSGWRLEASFFQYALNSYNHNFGIVNYVTQKDFPELCFTIVLRRGLLPIFIANIMPIGVVSFLLFAVLNLTKSQNDGPGSHGFSGMMGVSSCSGLLFIILLNQINLRNGISAMGIIYIEYFYFAVYIMIVLVIINALLYILSGKFKVIQYQHNLIPRLLYWPTFLGTLLLITLAVF